MSGPRGPGTSTLVVAGCVSALSFAGASAFLIHTFSMLPERVAEAAPPPPRATASPNPFRTQSPQEVAKQLGFNLREPTPAERQALRESSELRAKVAQRRERNRSITPPHWEQVLADATDLQAFMDEVVPVAEAGDTSAQFAVYLALSECMKLMRDHLARESQQRCKALSRTGKEMKADAARWLDRSAAGNYPRALAQRAIDRITETSTARMTKAERTQQLRDAEIDLVRALNSDDAVITWLAAYGVSILYVEHPRAQHAMWIWRLAACEQGFPCGEDAPWLQEMCAHFGDCRDGESGREYIRRKSGELPSLFARARHLATTLSAGKLDAGQFAATVTSIPETPREKSTAAVAPR